MMYDRNSYIERITPFLNRPMVKVITGMRRVGKSSFLRLLMEHLRGEGVPSANIVYVDLEALEFSGLRTYVDLAGQVKRSLRKVKGKAYVFIDEIQSVSEWERAVAAWSGHPEAFDVYVTGSNASLFSGELATRLAGRYIEFPIYPLSFAEFMTFRQASPDAQEKEFAAYLRYGGLPGIHTLGELTDDTVYPYLDAIFNTVLVKDLILRQNIRNVRLAEDVIRYVFDNIGNLTSANKITAFLKSQKISASVMSIMNYLRFITDAGLAHCVRRWDVKGKRFFKINDKYFAGDVGLRHALLGYRSTDLGGLLENVVCLELLRRGYRVSIGKIDNKEVDFIAESHAGRRYVQVAASIAAPETLQRELAPLRLIDDNYPKTILSLDHFQPDDFEGVTHRRIPDFLMNGF